MKNLQTTHNNEIITYQTGDSTPLEVRLVEETVWLTQTKMVQLFNRDKSVISRHIRNVFEEGELSKNSVVANFATTASDGKTYVMEYYHLDVIIDRKSVV